jgi:hypothetical protein
MTESPLGVLIDQYAEPDGTADKNSIVINGNNFTRLSRGGVLSYSGTMAIEQLNDNTFTNISGAIDGNSGVVAPGLRINSADGQFPSIKQARRNRFVGNDAAVFFEDESSVVFGANQPIDFGKPDDPGENVFRCNSASGGGGGDLLLMGASGALPFAGNVWDHFPPTTGTHGDTTNGTDIIFFDSPPPVVDIRAGSAGPGNCPNGRIP